MSDPRCPHCLETVNQNASKCRHCGSDLVERPTSEGGGTVFVVDRGLLRFAKFAGGILAIFIVFGTYIFGIDLKNLVGEMRALRLEIDQEREKMGLAQNELEATREEVLASRKVLDLAAGEIQESIDRTKGRVVHLEVLVSRAGLTVQRIEEFGRRVLDEQQQETAEIRRLTLAPAGVPDDSRNKKLWPVGQVLRVRFLEGTAEQREMVETIATEWTNFANIRFEFDSHDSEAEIRLRFEQLNGSWSFVGTDALGVAPTEPTMNLAWLSRQNILHEFGHVLGLVHETQNPDTNLVWNRPAVIRDLKGPPNNFSEANIEELIFKKLSHEDYPGRRDYDPLSTMGYTYAPQWVLEGIPPQPGEGLSESDKTYIADLYPRG